MTENCKNCRYCKCEDGDYICTNADSEFYTDWVDGGCYCDEYKA